MDNPLIRKLSSFSDFTPEDVGAVEMLCRHSRAYPSGSNLIKEGDRPDSVFLLLEGWAFRYKILQDGNRQIVAYLIPGDLCDINIFILRQMDHSIGLLSNARAVAIPRQEMLSLMNDRPRVAQALLWSTLVDAATLREWVVNVGQRDAFDSVAHLLCEMWLRMSLVGLVDGNRFALPLTQEQLGDTVGLTAVHVNRTLGRMRAEGLLEIKGKMIEILDLARLKDVAGFNPAYLHLDRRRPHAPG